MEFPEPLISETEANIFLCRYNDNSLHLKESVFDIRKQIIIELNKKRFVLGKSDPMDDINEIYHIAHILFVRTKKNDNNTILSYALASGQIIHETWGASFDYDHPFWLSAQCSQIVQGVYGIDFDEF